jgi:hypothetical protein
MSLGTILLAASSLPAQFGARTPSFGGVFAPIVGEGAAYEMTSAKDNKKMQMEMAITGKEEFEGKTGYWMEYSMSGMPQGMGTSKVLMSLSGDQTVTMRMVTRMGNDVIEMDMNMPMMKNRPTTAPADARHSAERVGTETITVPAGTFACEHWRAKDGSSDFWISEKVRPMGLVKMVGKDSSMVLVRQITGATTKLPPPYKKFDMQEMMRQQQQHP